eukprot:379547_1
MCTKVVTAEFIMIQSIVSSHLKCNDIAKIITEFSCDSIDITEYMEETIIINFFGSTPLTTINKLLQSTKFKGYEIQTYDYKQTTVENNNKYKVISEKNKIFSVDSDHLLILIPKNYILIKIFTNKYYFIIVNRTEMIKKITYRMIQIFDEYDGTDIGDISKEIRFIQSGHVIYSGYDGICEDTISLGTLMDNKAIDTKCVYANFRMRGT